jgi:RimJ/RimL family protein N-acetyltransferase
VKLELKTCEVRPWRGADADALVKYANNRNIWINLRDRFPYPYTKRAAREFLMTVSDRDPVTAFAIVTGGEAVGGIGYVPQTDVERVSAEIGYWLAEPFWGRGIMTEAVRAVTQFAIRQHRLTRVFALPFASNVASCRVLEKAGYVLEGRLRRSAIKDGVIVDQCLYGFIAEGEKVAGG